MKTGILFLHSATLPPLGADTWVHTLIMRYLDRSKHDVHVACAPGRKGSMTPTFQAVRAIAELNICPLNLGPELFSGSLTGRFRAALETTPALWNIAELALYVRKHRIGVVHTSDRPRDALASVILARLTGAKCIVHVHVKYGDWMSPMLRWSMSKANMLIGVSEFVANSLVTGGGYARARTRAVLNAIDLEKWDPDLDSRVARDEFRIGADVPLLICVARIFPGKGQEQLIRALALLRPEFPNVRALIVGQDYPPGSHHSEELKHLARELGVLENLIFTGLRRDVASLFAAADVLVMPSHEEPFGLVFAEALAMRRPVIACSNGGAPEVIDHGKSGLLSAAGDVPALAADIATLLRSRALRKEMGDYGRKQVELRFAAPRLAEDVSKLYAELLS